MVCCDYCVCTFLKLNQSFFFHLSSQIAENQLTKKSVFIKRSRFSIRVAVHEFSTTEHSVTKIRRKTAYLVRILLISQMNKSQ